MQNEDVALAKLLQEQERAFLSLSGGTRYVLVGTNPEHGMIQSDECGLIII